MRISEISVFVATNELGGEIWNPKIRWTRKHAVLLELRTGNGLCGVGECWCFDTEPDALVAFLRTEVIPRVLGLDAGERSGIHRMLTDTATLSARHGMMASAASGIDIALWDLAARAEGVPLYRLLGGGDGQVRLYASGGLYRRDTRPETLAGELEAYRRQGFDWFKLKVGGLSVEEDLARVLEVRARLGGRVRLAVDGVYSYDRRSALAFFERIREADISAFQSPLPAADIEGMAELVSRGVPVMALEAEYRPEIHRLLIEERSVAILQFALVACGGITAGQDLVRRSGGAGIPCSLEVSSTAIAEMAAFHFAAAHREVDSVEFHMVHRALFDLFPFPASAIDKGILTLPALPGLGIDIPKERVRRLV